MAKPQQQLITTREKIPEGCKQIIFKTLTVLVNSKAKLSLSEFLWRASTCTRSLQSADTFKNYSSTYDNTCDISVFDIQFLLLSSFL